MACTAGLSTDGWSSIWSNSLKDPFRRALCALLSPILGAHKGNGLACCWFRGQAVKLIRPSFRTQPG
jgi:hypothetical protein